MNKFRPAERMSGWLAMALSGLFYFILIMLVCRLGQSSDVERDLFSPSPVKMNFSQIELRAAESVPEPLAPTAEEPLPIQAEPEVVDVAQDPLPEPILNPGTKPSEAESASVPGDDRVTQSATSSQALSVTRAELSEWVRQQIEKEKYYPVAAQNAGYEGTFTVQVNIGTDGKVVTASVLDGQGHMLLRRSLKKILNNLTGRDSERKPVEPMELRFEFTFQLK